jgi:hypothetical protein
MVGQRLVQAVDAEPADGEVDLGLAHQPPVVDEAKQEAREHQPQHDLGIDARPPGPSIVQFSDLLMQPAEIKNAVNPDQDVVVWQQVTERSSDEQLGLSTLLLPNISMIPRHQPQHLEAQDHKTLFSSPLAELPQLAEIDGQIDLLGRILPGRVQEKTVAPANKMPVSQRVITASA